MLRLGEAPSCPNILELHQWLEDESSFTLIMEYPEPCRNLEDYILFSGPVSEAQARLFMLQVLQAVKHCHERGVYHGDIRSRNILVTLHSLELKLIDFRCARLISSESFNSSQYQGESGWWPRDVVLLMVKRTEALKLCVSHRIRCIHPAWGPRPVHIPCRSSRRLGAGSSALWDHSQISALRKLWCHSARLPQDASHLIHRWTHKQLHIMLFWWCLLFMFDVWRLTALSELFPACHDLIFHCLSRNPAHRLTLQQLEEHRWMKA